jgi:hypothetical protein
MTEEDEFELSPLAIKQARRIGLIGNVERRLQRMAKYAARFTHKEGNRRFESFILRIEDGVVRSIRRFDPTTGEVIHDVIGQLERRHEERRRMLQAIDKHLGAPAEEEVTELEPDEHFAASKQDIPQPNLPQSKRAPVAAHRGKRRRRRSP